MTVPYFAVICSTGNASIRKEVHYTIEQGQINEIVLGAGEFIVAVSSGPYASTAAYSAAINNAIVAVAGKSPGNARCAVIDGTNTVVGMIMADASIETVQGMTLVNTTAANIGDTYSSVSATFTPAPFTSPKAVGTVVGPSLFTQFRLW